MRVGSTSTCSNPAAVNLFVIILLVQRAGDAADPQQNILRTSGSDFAAGDHVGNGEASPGFRTRKASRRTLSLSAERLMTQLEMMTSTELSGSGMFSISPFRNSTFSMPDLRLFSLRKRQHLVGHIEAVSLARRTDAASREQHVDASARTQIEHDFARIQLGQRRRIAAAQRRQHRFLRNLLDLRDVVQVGGDGIATAAKPEQLRSRNCRQWSRAKRPARIFLSRLP